MSDYILISDSTADLPADIVNDMNIEIVPFNFTINEKTYAQYPDEREMTNKEFYHLVRNGAMPVTSQVNPKGYSDFFKEYLKQGKDILYICFTTGLSGSYQSAFIAANELMEKYPDRKIKIVDSRCASIGEGVLVYNAAKRRQAGMSMDELYDWVKANRNNARHWFMVEDLFHLKRGGRISSVEAVVGSALKIKPILSVDEAGKLVVKSKARGVNKAIDYLIGKVVSEGVDLSEQTIFIGNADSIEKAEKIKSLLIEKNIGKDYVITCIGPVIGSHVGSGMAAIAFMGKEEK